MTEQRKPLRWKEIRPNTERGYWLRRGDAVLGKVTPVRGRITNRVVGWAWTGRVGERVVKSEAPGGSAAEAKRQCLEWVKRAEAAS